MLNSLKWKLWLRQLSISSPRISVRAHLPLPLRMIIIAITVGLAGAIAMWIYDLGRGLTGFNKNNAEEQVIQYKKKLEELSMERDQFSSTVNAAESQFNIERSAQRQLASQIKTLELENVRLKEDLAFFESLLPNATSPQGIAIRRLKIDSVLPNQLRYRLLIMQGGKDGISFSGSLQLIVTILHGGKSAIMTFPEGNSSGEFDKFKLNFKHYQRVEGTLFLPEGALVKMVQARVLEKGQIRAQQFTTL